MKKQILMAADGSEKGLRAISILGNLLKDQKEFDVLLFHCVQQLAALYPGELGELSGAGRFSYGDQEKVGNAVLEVSRNALVESGFPPNRINTKLKMDSMDPAQDILKQADIEKIRSIACGRRGRGQLESLLLGSVSSKVAQYSQNRTVWVVDTPVHDSQKVLVAIEGLPDSKALTHYTAEFIAPISGLHFTFFHVMPPIPPTFWDDGHILGPDEQKDRQTRVEKWRKEWNQKVEKFMSEGHDALVSRGVPAQNIEAKITQTKEGVARDLLNEIAREEYQMVIMGKKSFRERKPFLMGSHANKVLQNIKRAILCLVDSP